MQDVSSKWITQQSAIQAQAGYWWSIWKKVTAVTHLLNWVFVKRCVREDFPELVWKKPLDHKQTVWEITLSLCCVVCIHWRLSLASLSKYFDRIVIMCSAGTNRLQGKICMKMVVPHRMSQHVIYTCPGGWGHWVFMFSFWVLPNMKKSY